jgi:hypothetical protein
MKVKPLPLNDCLLDILALLFDVAGILHFSLCYYVPIDSALLVAVTDPFCPDTALRAVCNVPVELAAVVSVNVNVPPELAGEPTYISVPSEM